MTLRIALVLLVCLVLSVLESVLPFLLHLRAARPDLLLSAVLYFALHDDVIEGASLSAAAGWLSDLTSTTPPLMYTFLALLTFIVVRMFGSALRTEGGVQSAVVAAGTSIVHSLLATLLFGFFAGAGFHIEFTPLLWSAFGTALGAPFVFRVLRKIDAGFLQGDTAATGTLR